MSELTPCNFCQAQAMNDRAEKRGVQLVLKLQTQGDMEGWWSARYSDQEEPSAWFKQLTSHCVC